MMFQSWPRLPLQLVALIFVSVAICRAEDGLNPAEDVSRKHLGSARELLGRVSSNEGFRESLSLKPLPDGKVSSTFEFVTSLYGVSPSFEKEAQHYTLYPLSLGQILRAYSVSEMHLTLNAGRWDYARWGYPAEEENVGSGGTMWAWIAEGGDTSIEEKWTALRNALAGLFCSSLGRMDELRTTSPLGPLRAADQKHPFAPSDLPMLGDDGQTHHLRHATLPSENVCTENLTPFLKLLPCKGKSGLASLLNPHKLFDANWHGLGVHVTSEDQQDGKGMVEVKLSFQAVLDPLRKPSVKKQDWSLESLFDRNVAKSCPVARESTVYVGVQDEYSLSPDPTKFLTWTGGQSAIYDVHSMPKPLNVAMSYPSEFDHLAASSTPPQTDIEVRRTLQESSQLSGMLDVSLTNHAEHEVQVMYLETMPWIVQFYLHTLIPRVNGVVKGNAISNISYTPSIPHGRPTTFQATFAIPANSTLSFTMDITKAFLRYTEHPPDAQRGWDLPPAVVYVESQGRKFYTPPLLITLATPDFSMPYNVIIFTCSLVAFIFGSVFNLLTRRFVVVKL